MSIKLKTLTASVLIMSVIMMSACTETTRRTDTNISESIKIPVIMYHGLTESEKLRNTYMIPPSMFEDDLKYLHEQGYTTIFVSELVDHFKKGDKLPEKPVILSFDDGYLNNYTYAFPLLKKYRCKAVISPIGIAADQAEDEKYRSPKWSQCKWGELREMHYSGLVEIENHTYSLHKNDSYVQGAAKKADESDEDYEKRLRADLKQSNDRITKMIGRKPCTFVYPFGAKSEKTESIVRSMGFSAIMDCENKMNTVSSEEDLFHLHRFLRDDKNTLKEIMEN